VGKKSKIGGKTMVKNNGGFLGHVEASSGYFHGRVEADEGIFRGSIVSGPLVLMDETPSSNTITYNTGTSGRTIVETELNRKGITPHYNSVQNWTFNVSGTYSGQKIITIRFQTGGPSRSWAVRVTFENGTQLDVAYPSMSSSVPDINLSGQLSFAYTSGGKTFKLMNLPTQDPHVPGAVWRNGNQLMISL
jgi:hypothetical protein